MEAALVTGFDPAIVALSFAMHKVPRTISDHGAETSGVRADRGLLAGCGFAVRFLKAILNKGVKGGVGFRDYVDDVVLQDESDTPEGVVASLRRGAGEGKDRFVSVGPVLNDAKEQIFVPTMATMRSWANMNPDYSGRVAKSVKDLVGFSAVGVGSPDRGDRVDKASEVCGRVKALTLGPMAKKVIIKAAAQSVALYGVAVDTLMVNHVGRLRGAYSSSIWPRKCVASNTVGLPLVGNGRRDPQLEVVKRAVAANLKQAKNGLPNGVWNVWEDTSERPTRSKGPISNYIKAINWIGWKPVGPCSIEHKLGVSDVTSYVGMVEDSSRAARGRLWDEAIRKRIKHGGITSGDEEVSSGLSIKGQDVAYGVWSLAYYLG